MSIDKLKKALEMVLRALLNRPDDTAENNKIKKELEVFKAKDKELESLEGLLDEVIEKASAATSEGGNGGGEKPPAAGRSNIKLGFSTDNREAGGELYAFDIKNLDVKEGQKNNLSLLAGAIKNSVETSGTRGEPWVTHYYFDVDGERSTFTANSQEQKLEADVVALSILQSAAVAARDAFLEAQAKLEAEKKD